VIFDWSFECNTSNLQWITKSNIPDTPRQIHMDNFWNDNKNNTISIKPMVNNPIPLYSYTFSILNEFHYVYKDSNFHSSTTNNLVLLKLFFNYFILNRTITKPGL
jgi:hypothetical protein